MKEKHRHHGHRQRKKEYFLKHGIDDMPDHEKLEFLLYYAIPTGDTNELAHRLIDHFGDFVNVITARYEDLLEVKGVKDHTASMICLFRMTARYFIMERKGNILWLNNTEALNNYCAAMFLDADNEQVRCVFLDNELNLIDSEKICEGDFGKVELPLRGLLQQVFKMRSNRIVIAHNHPYGSSMPSRLDADVTYELRVFLEKVGIELIDHVITGTDGVWSMREHETLPDIWRT
ncbi:MAG: DNA repair protein [Oscillospiraceae bacterium]|jgi:DNA repair protein RadC|nr:DNA repair protein [Oscillospiraceae bacterium]